MGCKWSSTGIYRLEPGESLGSAVLSFSVFRAACDVDFCSRGSIVYGIMEGLVAVSCLCAKLLRRQQYQR